MGLRLSVDLACCSQLAPRSYTADEESWLCIAPQVSRSLPALSFSRSSDAQENSDRIASHPLVPLAPSAYPLNPP
jgi:hypothetical protein